MSKVLGLLAASLLFIGATAAAEDLVRDAGALEQVEIQGVSLSMTAEQAFDKLRSAGFRAGEGIGIPGAGPAAARGRLRVAGGQMKHPSTPSSENPMTINSEKYSRALPNASESSAGTSFSWGLRDNGSLKF